jgi:hypothetical protein
MKERKITTSTPRGDRPEQWLAAMRRLRESADLAPATVAQKLARSVPKVDAATIERWETGEVMPTLAELAVWLEAVGASLVSLFVEQQRGLWGDVLSTDPKAGGSPVRGWKAESLEAVFELLTAREQLEPRESVDVHALAERLVWVEILQTLAADEQGRLEKELGKLLQAERARAAEEGTGSGDLSLQTATAALRQVGNLRRRARPALSRVSALMVEVSHEIGRRHDVLLRAPCNLGLWSPVALFDGFTDAELALLRPYEEREMFRQWDWLLRELADWRAEAPEWSLADYYQAVTRAFWPGLASTAMCESAPREQIEELAIRLKQVHYRFRAEHPRLSESSYGFAPQALSQALLLATCVGQYGQNAASVGVTAAAA